VNAGVFEFTRGFYVLEENEWDERQCDAACHPDKLHGCGGLAIQVSKRVLELIPVPTFSIAANIGMSGPCGRGVVWKALNGERMIERGPAVNIRVGLGDLM